MRIRDFMSKDAVRITADADVAAAREALRFHEVEHLVVMDGKRVAGVIAREDLAGAGGETSVSAVMTRDIVTVAPTVTLRRAAAAMAGRAVGCLPVVEKGELLGIVTTSDLLRALGKGEIHAAPPPERFTLKKRGFRKRPVVI
jgi:CBS domain-containing protein